jgi:cytidylate kinase
MAKRKQNESIRDFRERVSKDEIMDTSPDPILCDTSNDNSNIVLETRLNNYRGSNDMVFSMRMNGDLLDHIKQIAREKSVELKKDVPYQLLIIQAVEEKYPLPEEK